MKKINLIWVFVAFVLGGVLFFLGMWYGDNNQASTGNIIRENFDNSGEEYNNIKEEIEKIKDDFKDLDIPQVEYYREISGGGSLFGNLPDAKSGNGFECFSWGNSFCQNSTTFHGRVELKCSKGYERVLTGFYTSNIGSSSNFETIFVCLDENLAEINNSLKISQG